MHPASMELTVFILQERCLQTQLFDRATASRFHPLHKSSHRQNTAIPTHNERGPTHRTPTTNTATNNGRTWDTRCIQQRERRHGPVVYHNVLTSAQCQEDQRTPNPDDNTSNDALLEIMREVLENTKNTQCRMDRVEAEMMTIRLLVGGLREPITEAQKGPANKVNATSDGNRIEKQRIPVANREYMNNPMSRASIPNRRQLMLPGAMRKRLHQSLTKSSGGDVDMSVYDDDEDQKRAMYPKMCRSNTHGLEHGAKGGKATFFFTRLKEKVYGGNRGTISPQRSNNADNPTGRNGLQPTQNRKDSFPFNTMMSSDESSSKPESSHGRTADTYKQIPRRPPSNLTKKGTNTTNAWPISQHEMDICKYVYDHHADPTARRPQLNWAGVCNIFDLLTARRSLYASGRSMQLVLTWDAYNGVDHDHGCIGGRNRWRSPSSGVADVMEGVHPEILAQRYGNDHMHPTEDLRLVYMPVLEEDSEKYWFLAVVDLSERQVFQFDTNATKESKARRRRVIQCMLTALDGIVATDGYKNSHSKSAPEFASLDIMAAPGVPKNSSSTDSGIWVMQWMAMGRRFTHAVLPILDEEKIRIKMAIALLTGRCNEKSGPLLAKAAEAAKTGEPCLRDHASSLRMIGRVIATMHQVFRVFRASVGGGVDIGGARSFALDEEESSFE
ncbi:hypothetical protein HN873_064575 [Arachis hypogaea]